MWRLSAPSRNQPASRFCAASKGRGIGVQTDQIAKRGVKRKPIRLAHHHHTCRNPRAQGGGGRRE